MKSGKLSLELYQSPSCPAAPFLPCPSPLQKAFILFVSCCLSAAHLFHTPLWFLSAFLYLSIRARCVYVRVNLYRGKWKKWKNIYITQILLLPVRGSEINKANDSAIIRQYSNTLQKNTTSYTPIEQKSLLRIISQFVNLCVIGK